MLGLSYQESLRVIGRFLDMEVPVWARSIVEENRAEGEVFASSGDAAWTFSREDLDDMSEARAALRSTGLKSPGPRSDFMRTVGIGLDGIGASEVYVEVQEDLLLIRCIVGGSSVELAYTGSDLRALREDAIAHRRPSLGPLSEWD